MIRDYGGSQLPNNSTKFERALAAGLRILPQEWRASGRVGDVKADLLDETVPFMIWELGLEPVMPYISEPRRVLKDGRAWQRVRGTPVSISMSLGWIDVKAKVEENPEGLRWDLFQLGLDEIPTTEKKIADIIGLAKLSKASNTELIRIYSGYDLRGARLNKARINGPNLLNDWSGAWVKDGWPKLSFGHSFVGTAEFGANWPLLGWQDRPWPKDGFKSRQVYRADSMERCKRQRGFRVNRHHINGPEKLDPRLSQGRSVTAEVVRASSLALRVTPWPAEGWPDHGLPDGSWRFGRWQDKPHARLREKPWPLGPWRAEHYDLRLLTATAVPYQVPYDEATFIKTSFLADREVGWLLGPWPRHWPRLIDWPRKEWPDAPLAEWPFGATGHSERLDSRIADLSHRGPARWPYDGEPQVPHGKGAWPGPWSDNPWPGEKWENSPWPGSGWHDVQWPAVAWPDGPVFGAGWQDAPWPGVRWSDRQWPGSAWGDKVWPAIGWKAEPWPNSALPSVPWPDGEMDRRWERDEPWPGTPWPSSLADDGLWGKSQVWPAVPWSKGVEDDGIWGREAPWPGISWPDGNWEGPWLSQNWPDDPWRGAEGWVDVAWPNFRWPQSNITENGTPSVQWFTGEWPDWPLPQGRWPCASHWPEVQTHHSFKATRVLH